MTKIRGRRTFLNEYILDKKNTKFGSVTGITWRRPFTNKETNSNYTFTFGGVAIGSPILDVKLTATKD